MEKAFGYARVSGKGQIEGDGFPRQMKAIREHAAVQNIRIARVFREEGVSGTIETMDRPAWAEMIAALQCSGVRMIVVEKLDRVARDLMVQEACIADLQKHGFTLISVQEPDLMANDPTRVLMRQLLGAVAQYDKSQIVAKLRSARTRIRAKHGRCEGRKPYGHREGETAVLERIREMRRQGWAFERIAAHLNAENIPTRTGKPWFGVVVNRIITGRRRDL